TRMPHTIGTLPHLLNRSSTTQTSVVLTRSFIEYGIPQQTSPANQTPSRLTGKHRVAVRIAAIRSGYTQLVAPVCFQHQACSSGEHPHGGVKGRCIRRRDCKGQGGSNEKCKLA